MGLDQYAYAAANGGDAMAWADHEYGAGARPLSVKPRELAYWRKHPNLEGFMSQLWESRGKPGVDAEYEDRWGSGFNGIELELKWEDLDALERAVTEGTLPETKGFFFGNNADDQYRDQDLQFIRDARAEIFTGLRVFYKSSW